MQCSNLDVLYYKVSSWKPQKYIIWILEFFLKTDQTKFYAILKSMFSVGQGGRSCAGARVAPAEKFGLRRYFVVN